MDPSTNAMLLLFVIAMTWAAVYAAVIAGEWVWRAIRSIRPMCAREDRTMDTASRMRVRGQA